MKKTVSMTLTFALTAMLLVSICIQAMPYFTGSDGQAVSLAKYIWFPTEYTQVTEYLSSSIDGYSINNILLSGIFLPLCAVALAFLLWKFRDNIVVTATTCIWGLWGIVGYSTNAALRLGGSAYTLSMVLFISAAVLSAIYLLMQVKTKSKEPNV